MLILGIIKAEEPTALIDPMPFRNAIELHHYLERILNPQDFSLSNALTVDMLENGLKSKQPMQINFAGYRVALLMGEERVIQDNTDRFVHAGLLEEFLRNYGHGSDN